MSMFTLGISYLTTSKLKWLSSSSSIFPSGLEVKVSASNAGDLGSIPGSGRSPGEGNGNPLQYSCLENPRDGGAWWAAIYGVAQSRTRLKRLSSSNQAHPQLGIVFALAPFFSFFPELCLHWSPVAYWAPTDLGSSSFIVLSFCLFLLFMRVLKRRILK